MIRKQVPTGFFCGVGGSYGGFKLQMFSYAMLLTPKSSTALWLVCGATSTWSHAELDAITLREVLQL